MTPRPDKEIRIVRQEEWGRVLVMDSVGQMSAAAAGQIVVAGSHGAGPAARHAAQFLPFGLILNDAGRGKNDAGVSGLGVLEAMDILGATVDGQTARIGDGWDNYAAGVISAVNDKAAAVGVKAGLSAAEATGLMLQAKKSAGQRRAAFVVHEDQNGRIVVTDTISYLSDSHRRSVVVGGSHCAATSYDWVKNLDLKGIFLNDAGRGKDEANISGLPLFEAASIPAGAIDCRTAMIGHGRDAWENGLLSAVNRTAEKLGISPGMSVREAALRVLEAGQGHIKGRQK